MTIVIVGSYPLSEDCICGGVESSVFGLVQGLCDHNVHVFDIPRVGINDTIERGRVCVYRFLNRGHHNEEMVTRVEDYTRIIVDLHPDVVHIHGTGRFCHQLYLDINSCGIPSIVTIHGLLAVEKRKALVKSLSIKTFKRFPKALYQYLQQTKVEYAFLEDMKEAIVDTQYVSDALEKYPVKHLPSLKIIPQGIDKRFYNLRCNGNSDVILSVGSISPRKGHILLVEAFNTACIQGLKAKLHIVGVVADTAYYSQLQEAIKLSPYSDRISLTVNASRSEVDSAYSEATVFALHTQEESQGIVFAEAMATGLPVISTNVGGVPFVVRNQCDGLLSEYGDTDTFASNLKELIEDKDRWKLFSESAVKQSQNYNWKRIVEEIVFCYSQVRGN